MNKPMPKTMTLDTPQQVAEQFASDFASWVNASTDDFHVALSGGSTPKLLFQLWASDTGPETDWNKVQFYWGDERCVPPDDPDSNYGVANELFFKPAGIDEKRIHRVLGENDPENEAVRYSQLLTKQLKSAEDKPVFDLVILGMGGDGHTASIFPNQMSLMDDRRVCGVATHPESGQKRVTINGPMISSAQKIAFLITGSSKTEKYNGIVNQTNESQTWPATRFFHAENTIVYLDFAAAGQ